MFITAQILALRRLETICAAITMNKAKKNIAEPITFACAGIPRPAET
jgi:hypothetical protein